jgi:Flp pilus assembly protein TadB
MYSHATRARDVIGRRAFAAFVGFLLAAYGANLGPPPPSITALVITAIAGAAVIILWAWWFDRHRVPIA